jgi:hypothetical protein
MSPPPYDITVNNQPVIYIQNVSCCLLNTSMNVSVILFRELLSGSIKCISRHVEMEAVFAVENLFVFHECFDEVSLTLKLISI